MSLKKPAWVYNGQLYHESVALPSVLRLSATMTCVATSRMSSCLTGSDKII